MSLSVAPAKRSFLKDQYPFFYLADTIWSAFTHPTQEDWRYYVHYRARQGFTALQISILPILHDTSESAISLVPFVLDSTGGWDFSSPSPTYFARAATMLQAAREAGLVPALVLLWCNYVPGTWASNRHPGPTMPLEAVRGYVEYVTRAFADFDPIYIISGDTDFEAPEPSHYYTEALRMVKQCAPTALTTMHLAPQADLPDEFVRSPDLDFYMFQSGHHLEEQQRAYTLAERFAGKAVVKPVVNGEPPYEGHGHGHRYGRFSAFDVRRASWQSLLAGASAGVTYGAHGVWSWHQRGKAFSSEPFSGRPFDWHDALRLEGAWDISFARALFERYALHGVVARQDLLDASPEIRLATSAEGDRLALYIPYPTEVALAVDAAAYEWTRVDLAERHWEEIQVTTRGEQSVIPMHEANSDSLVLGLRRS